MCDFSFFFSDFFFSNFYSEVGGDGRSTRRCVSESSADGDAQWKRKHCIIERDEFFYRESRTRRFSKHKGMHAFQREQRSKVLFSPVNCSGKRPQFRHSSPSLARMTQWVFLAKDKGSLTSVGPNFHKRKHCESFFTKLFISLYCSITRFKVQG